MHLVESNAQPIEGETNAREYDFSRAAVQARWRAGYADASRMLERRPWADPIGGILTSFEVARTLADRLSRPADLMQRETLGQKSAAPVAQPS
jgi:hypothetical protein